MNARLVEAIKSLEEARDSADKRIVGAPSLVNLEHAARHGWNGGPNQANGALSADAAKTAGAHTVPRDNATQQK